MRHAQDKHLVCLLCASFLSLRDIALRDQLLLFYCTTPTRSSIHPYNSIDIQNERFQRNLTIPLPFRLWLQVQIVGHNLRNLGTKCDAKTTETCVHSPPQRRKHGARSRFCLHTILRMRGFALKFVNRGERRVDV